METTREKRKILVVDDDQSLLDAIERVLIAAGEDVEACATFAAGRAALRARRFDALLTDVRLGEFNGLQLAFIARDVQPHIRIIVFSGFEDPVLRSEAAALGAEYLVKPVSGSQLHSLLRQANTS